jgi:S1-C subfamily serine protease
MPQVLSELSDALAGSVDAAAPSVVRIEGRERLPGTGIVWDSSGTIVTAHHVLERDDNIKIGTHGGETVEAELIGRDPAIDVAVLRAPSASLAAPQWAEPDAGPDAEPDTLRVGHLALSLGRPGHNVRATLGIISALGQAWRTPAGGSIDRYLQTDTVMYPGFSGGPLVDAEGRFIGLNSSALVHGISVAVPAPTLRRVVQELQEHGKVRRAYLGVVAQPTRLPESVAQQLEQETGLLLVSVEAGGAAESGGLFMGDTLVSLGGSPVRHLDDLLSNLGGDSIGQRISARVLRGGQLIEVTLSPNAHS